MKDTLLMMSGEIYENSNDNEKALKNYEELYSSSVDPTVKDNTAAKILDIHLAKNNLKAAQKYIEGITNLDIKSYYDSLIYEKQGDVYKRQVIVRLKIKKIVCLERKFHRCGVIITKDLI